MAQEPSISSSHETLESPPVTSSDSNNSNNQSLTRNGYFSRLNAKAPEFVPRTTAAVVSPPPSVISAGAGDLIHVYPPPSPNPPFHVPIPVNVPVNVQNHHHHGHHHHHHHHHNHHGHGTTHHGQHYVPVQYHHHNQNHNQNHNHHRPFNGGGGGTGFIDQKEVVAQAQRTEPELKDGLTDEATQKIVNQAVKSPALDYSHFISLPLAINPQLIHKLVNFQNSILGISDANADEVPDNTSNKDSTNKDGRSKKLDKAPQVAVTLKTQKDRENVNVDVTKIPLVSYPAKSSTASTSEPKTSMLSELGIDKSIFIKPKTFHLTVLMLKLWNKERVDAAVRIFKGIEAEVMDALDGRPVSIRLKGLDCMRGSLAKARVLYAPVEVVGGEDRLMHACKIITDAFTKGGLVLEKDSRQALKLHATVMNARHRKRTMNTKKFDTFDARGVVEQYGSEEWGEYLLREVHLSQRFVFDKNGYYHCCASMPLPKDVQAD